MSPNRVDVVAVGGGVVGSCVAYLLARAGIGVVVVDPGPGQGASAGNAGLVVPSYILPMSNPDTLTAGLRSLLGKGKGSLTWPLSAHTVAWLAKFVLASRPGRAWRDARALIALAESSRRCYQELRSELDFPLRETGFLHLVRDRRVLAAELRTARKLAAIGVRFEALDSDALAALEPGLAGGFIGAIRYPDDASLDPERTTQAFADAAVRHGAVFRTERVVGVRTVAGRIDAVETTGGTIAARAFVLSAGAESAAVSRLFGIRLPVEPGYGWSLTLPAQGLVLRHAVQLADEHVVVNSGPDRIRLTGGMEFGGPASAAPRPEAIATLRAVAEVAIPAIRDIADPGTAWRGARPMTPTGMPIIRQVGHNLVAATGHGPLGITLAPATGRIVADLLTRKGSPLRSS